MKKQAMRRSRPATLYQEIANSLRARIMDGTYRSNDKLPSLAELVAEFGASAISVRRALRDLAYEDLIYGEQGRGVFVKPKGVIHRVFATDAQRSMGDEIQRAGFRPTIRELKFERIVADDEIAARLKIAAGHKIHCHQKLVQANDEPVSLHFLYFPSEVAPRLKPYLARFFVFPMLKRAGFRVHRTHFEFAAMALNNDYAALFQKPAGFPMGVLHFTPMNGRGSPIVSGTTIFRSDRFIFDLDVVHRNA